MGNEQRYQVYCHYNKVNGKCYYGVTKNTWEDRWKTKYPSNSHFNRAIQKYAEEDWGHEVVAEGLTREHAAEYEKALIEFFDTTNPLHGYNKGRGGEGVNPLDSLYAKMHSKEYHEALSEAMKRVWAQRTEEERKALGKRYTFHFTKEQLSEKSRAAWQRPEYREKMRRYYAERRAERESDQEYIKNRELSKQHRKEYNRRYHAEHYVPVDPETKHRNISDAQKRKWEDEEYRNAALGRKRDPQVRERIRQHRLGTQHSEQELSAISAGMKERWRDPEFRASISKPRPPRTEEQKERARKGGKNNGRSVLCVEKGIIYPTIGEAARSIGMDRKRFQNALKSGYRIRGYHWKIIGEVKEPGRSVQCLESGAIYETITIASQETGISKSGICGACNGNRKTAGGFHWKYV